MSLPERFWWYLTVAAVVWYTTVTIYVSARGVIDIRNMLRRFREHHTPRS